jgi:hypothetical protein
MFFYVDERVRPETDPSGRPAVTLLSSGTGGVLQLGARWGPDEAELAALKTKLAESFPDVKASFMRLVPAPAQVKEATLVTGGTAPKTLATSSTSGFPPYSAVFRAPVEGDDFAAVTSALGGATGRLFVRYTVGLQEPSAYEAVLSGVIENAGTLKDEAAAERLVRAALADRKLVLSVVGGDDPALRAEVEAAAVDQAARNLLADANVDPKLPRQLEVRAEKKATRESKLEAEADVGTWFADGSGTQHIITTPGGSVQPT